ncbi:MAG: hypothetical protein BGO67_07745 [Alphaproteobacteria bacterium 41-28]|nr:MAG: hypothetical protein BGO67_07745 [Alphaproteobacteria bacterium 41-28]
MRKRFLFLGFICFSVPALGGYDYVDFCDLNFSHSPQQKIRVIKEESEKKLSNIIAFGFSNNNITSVNFATLTNELKPEQFTKIQLLDLSDNQVDESSAESLARWLRLDSQPYIKLTGTPVAVKNVAKLSNKFKELYPDEASSFMERIIFMSRNYVAKASQSVQVYQKLTSQNVLPHNWTQIHKEFYDSEVFAHLLKERESQRYNLVMRNMQHLSTSARRSPTPINPQEEGIGEEDLLNFHDALTVVTH